MQKSDEKKILGSVPKKLQLVENFWDCPEFSRNKKTQRGITLIALIITIIVMLILVGVTINVALNGGLFEKADEAKKLTLLRADEEELQIEIATAYDEKETIVNLDTLAKNLRDKGWDVTESGDKLICTSPNKNVFTVGIEGKIETNPGGGNEPGGSNPEGFDWQTTVGLKVEPNINYVYSTPDLAMPFVMNFTDDGYVTIKAGSMILLEEKAAEKLDTETGKVKGNLSIPGGIEGEALIWTNNEDDNDTNVYVEMLGDTVGFEKIEILPKEEINVYTGEIYGIKVTLIEISETEAIMKTGSNKPEKIEINECSKLNELEDLGEYQLDSNDVIPYSKAANAPGEPSGAVYWDILDRWYLFGMGNNTLQIQEEAVLERDITISQNEIQAIINEANAETN